MSRFTVASNGDLDATLARVEKTITGKGGSFSGDTKQGQFSGVTPVGNVKGKYSVNANKDIEITITDKPFIAPMSVIENKIRDYFA
jgi:hypothetical protein